MGSIAFCGTRGIPASYGGFETAVDEISSRFVEDGLECEVFCRRNSASPDYPVEHEGRKLVYVNGSRMRNLDTVLSSIQTAIHILRNRHRYDYIFWFNNANFFGIILTLISGVPLAINTDGLEWRRAKWSIPFKVYYFITSLLISKICKTLISDSISIQRYYKQTFRTNTYFIPYGAPVRKEYTNDFEEVVLRRYGLDGNGYFLQITRFEPDNLPLDVVSSFIRSGLSEKGYKMVLVGYKDATSYSKKIKELSSDDGIIVLDACYDKDILGVLRKNCYCYVHGNSVGGTNPALLEAMTSAPRIMAIDVPFSREVLSDLGEYFTLNNITDAFVQSTDFQRHRLALRDRVAQYYSWDDVTRRYKQLISQNLVSEANEIGTSREIDNL